MLCAPVFIFTSGSSALLGCPGCGLLMGLSLLAIFNTLFWVYVNLFREKTDKTWYVWYENGRLQLLDAKTINTESLFKLGSKWLIITDINNYCMYKLLCAMHSLQLCKNNCLGGGGGLNPPNVMFSQASWHFVRTVRNRLRLVCQW